MVKIYQVKFPTRSWGWRTLRYVVFSRTKQHLFLVSIECENQYSSDGRGNPRHIRVKLSEARKKTIMNFDEIVAYDNEFFQFPAMYNIAYSNEERREDWKDTYQELKSN
jgi:hypothetical protein